MLQKPKKSTGLVGHLACMRTDYFYLSQYVGLGGPLHLT